MTLQLFASCRHEHLGATQWVDPLMGIVSSRPTVNLTMNSTTHALALL